MGAGGSEEFPSQEATMEHPAVPSKFPCDVSLTDVILTIQTKAAGTIKLNNGCDISDL